MYTPWDDFFSDRALRLVERDVDLALDEDGPELTAHAIFAEGRTIDAVIRAKEDTFVVGLPMASIILRRLEEAGYGRRPACRRPDAGSLPKGLALPPWSITIAADEGRRVAKGTVVARLHGPAAMLLKAERVILNYICHLSGIANLTARYADELKGTGVRLLDTRKTTPGLRWPEKYAVQLGGGMNHRMDLTDMLMLKDNHIDAAGSIAKAVAAVRAAYDPCPPVEVECRTCAHVREAVAAHADRIMLDNLRGPALAEALSLIPEGMEAETSGGITLENIRSVALTGTRRTNFISVGRLTHSARAADFSMALGPADAPLPTEAA